MPEEVLSSTVVVESKGQTAHWSLLWHFKQTYGAPALPFYFYLSPNQEVSHDPGGFI